MSEERRGRRYSAGALAVAAVALFALLLRLRFLVGGGGPLASPTDYDDGVYYSVSALLVRGVLPYRDFVFVHPPGIAWFYAIVSWWNDPAAGFAIARVMAALVGAINTALVGAIVLRSRSAFAAAVAALLYAVYPDAVNAERSTYLEPLLNLCCLSSAFIWLAPSGDARPRSFTAGLAAGAASAVKLLGGIWVLAAVGSAPAGDAFRAVARFVAGGLVAGLVLLGPLALIAPSQFVTQVLWFQLSRPSDGSSAVAERLPLILGSGHVAATVLSAFALLAIVFVALRRGARMVTREQRFFAVATVLTVAAFAASSSYWPHYNSYLAASQCVLAGLGLAAVMGEGRMVRLAVAVVAMVIVIALQVRPLRDSWNAGATRSAELIALRRSATTLLRAGDSLFAFDPSWSLVAGRLPAHGDGAPAIVDSYGAMLITATRSGARAATTEGAFRLNGPQPDVHARLEKSTLVIPGWRGNWQLPDADRHWLHANYLCVTPEAGDLCIRRRLLAPFRAIALGPLGQSPRFHAGWHYEEGTPPDAWRWMSKRGVIELPPVAGAARLHLELHVPVDLLPNPPAVSLTLDGRLLERFAAESGAVVRSYDVAGTGGPQTLTIETSETMVPSRSGTSSDDRELGLSIRRVVWVSADEWRSLFR